MFGIDNYPTDHTEALQRHINASTSALARDLASLLNRAKDHGVAIVPDVDDDGISYSIEWYFADKHHALDVEYDVMTSEWNISVSDIEAGNV
jgi:5S rRNA maturation endonuclease (ribonuclease M5)